MDTQCFPRRNMTSYFIIQKISFNHKKLTPNQYSDLFWVQNGFSVHNFHLILGFCEIWQKSVIITVKNYEKYGKTTFFFDKN